MGRRIRGIKTLVPCIIQPADDYGLYHTYDRELFCLLSRVSINMFSWEVKNVNSANRLVTLSNIDGYIALLEKVDVYTTPTEFLKQLVSNKELVGPYKNHEELVEISELRLWQWQKHFRGSSKRSGNKIEVQFKSKLNSNQESKLRLFLAALYGENYA